MNNLALAHNIDINFEAADWVYDAFADTTPYQTNWVTGGLGAAKTRGAAQWHILNCFRNYLSPVSWSIAPTYPKADSILIPAFIESLTNDFGLVEEKDFNIRGKNPAYINLLVTNQVIKFQSANKWRMFIGDNISHFSATEVGFYESREWLAKVWARTRCKKASINQGLGEGTPEGYNWFQELADFDDYDNDNLFRRFIVETMDNPHLPPGFVENLFRQYAHDKAKLRSYIYGLFVPFTKGNAYWEWFDSRNSVLDVKASPALDLILSFDFQKSPLSWVVMQRQPFIKKRFEGHRLVVLGEAGGEARGLMNACIEFAVQFDPAKFERTPIVLDGGHDGYFDRLDDDGTSVSYFDQIERHLRALGFKNVRIEASRAAPPIKDRYEVVNTMLAYEMYVVAAWCRNTIKSHQETEFKPGTFKPKKHKDANKDMTHFGDAAGYPIYRLCKDLDPDDIAPRPTRAIITQI